MTSTYVKVTTQFLSIDWIDGKPQTGADEDEARAIKAAEAILDAAKADYMTAMHAYDVAIEAGASEGEFGDAAVALGAQVWADAQRAANSALTEGWYNPNGAFCTLRAYADGYERWSDPS